MYDLLDVFKYIYGILVYFWVSQHFVHLYPLFEHKQNIVLFRGTLILTT